MLFTFRYVFLAKQFSTSSTTVVYGWQKLYRASEKVFCNSTIFGWGWLTWHSRLRFEKCIENLPDVIWITIESLSKSWIRMGCHFQSFSILVSILFFFVKIENSNTEKFCIGMHIQRSIMHADLDATKLLFQRILNIFWWWWESICWAYCCTLFEKSNFCPKIQL